jgi:hypothetical protein
VGRPRLRWENNVRSDSVAAEHKRMEEMGRWYGYLEANCWRGQGPMWDVAPLKKKKSRNPSPFMQSEGSLPYSKRPAFGSCSKPNESSSTPWPPPITFRYY